MALVGVVIYHSVVRRAAFLVPRGQYTQGKCGGARGLCRVECPSDSLFHVIVLVFRVALRDSCPLDREGIPGGAECLVPFMAAVVGAHVRVKVEGAGKSLCGDVQMLLQTRHDGRGGRPVILHVHYSVPGACVHGGTIFVPQQQVVDLFLEGADPKCTS